MNPVTVLTIIACFAVAAATVLVVAAVVVSTEISRAEDEAEHRRLMAEIRRQR